MSKAVRCILLSFILLIALCCNFAAAEEVQITETFGDWSVGRFVDDFGDPTGETFLYTKTTGTFSNTAAKDAELTVVFMYQNGDFAIRLLEYNQIQAVYYDNSKITLKYKVDDVVYEHSLYPSAPPNADILINDRMQNMAEIDPSDTAKAQVATFTQTRSQKNSAFRQIKKFLSNSVDLRCVMYIDSSKYSFTISSKGFGDAVFGKAYDEAVQKMENGRYEEAIADFRSFESYKDSAERVRECIAHTYGPVAEKIEKIQAKEGLSLAGALAELKVGPAYQESEGSKSYMEKLEKLAKCEGVYLYVLKLKSENKDYLLTIRFRIENGEIRAAVDFEAVGGTYINDVVTVLPDDNTYLCSIEADRHMEGDSPSKDFAVRFWLNEQKALYTRVGEISEFNMECVRVADDYREQKIAQEEEEAARLKAEEEAKAEAERQKEEEEARQKEAEKAYNEAHYSSHAYKFSEGLCRISRSGKYGFINAQGEIVVPVIYDYAEDFHEGRALVYTGVKGGYKYEWYRDRQGKCGYVDKEGNEVVPLVWDYSDGFSQGRAVVAKGDLWGFIDPDGNEVIPCEYESVESFTAEQLAMVRKDQKTGYINTDGEVVIPLQYDAGTSFSDGFAAVWNKKTKKHANIGTDGKILGKKWYNDCYSFSDGMGRVSDGKKYGFIDTSGKQKIKCKYEYAGNFSEGLCFVQMKDDGEVYLIDKEDHTLLKEKLYANTGEIEVFRNGYAFVEKARREYWILNTEGKTIAKLKGKLMKNLGDGYFIYTKDGTKGTTLIDASGKELFSDMRDIDYGEGLFTVLDNKNNLTIYDRDMNQLF